MAGMLTEGATFAAYEVRRLIAVGGMGEVYLCRHRLLDRLDAVKILRAHLAAADGFRRRFLREALSAARLRHPNVVSVYTADESDGLLYLAMEYVAGEDLAALLRRQGQLTAARTLRLLAVVADALDAAHRAKLVHRDIKPSNLIVTSPGTPTESVTLVDFGISRILDADSDITRTGEVVGTIAYCAPEQLSRHGVDGTCDQYALACVAYECLTGEVPFPRESQLAIVTAHLTAAPPAVTALRSDLPASVDAVIAHALAKDPRQRFATCIAFVEALGAALAPAGQARQATQATKATEATQATEANPAGHGAQARQDAQPDHPGPAALAAQAAGAIVGLSSPGADLLTFRVGRRPSATGNGGHVDAMVVSLSAGPLGVRGDANATAACIRWLLAQAVSRHRPRVLCLVCALRASGDESWLWVNWLPHARPRTPPVPGQHVATAADTAADLLVRLGALVAARRVEARDGGAVTSGRVLAVLDTRLGVRPEDARMEDAHRLGVHIVYRLDAGESAPTNLAILDLDEGMATCRLVGPGAGPMDGVPDGVTASYVRELAETLPDA